ncbi:hypothetical protein MCZ47_16400 [Bacillus altitudinis]|uniref:hypothetical protein n=1 Tax=Bacillus altitudinis TaxID=293387 RepID=UPI00228163D5|nr:hypothetical protein [Bacillus altitudinis]MCY7451822.1 hypothetical protein [Bacillus altitudinis]
MAALKGVKTLDMVDGEITKVSYEGAEYGCVEGEAKVGDLVHLAEVGAFYKCYDVDFEGDAFFAFGIALNRSKYELFRKKHTRLKVGDYAKVVGDTYYRNIVRGAIVKITDLADKDGDLRFELVGDCDHDFAKPSSLEEVSAEEEEEAKWAKIGRKVDEYKVGDIAKYRSDGEICEVIKVEGYITMMTAKHGYCPELLEDIELITPVEARFDRS